MLSKLAQRQNKAECLNSNAFSSNPINAQENETVKRLSSDFSEFISFLDDTSIDKVINQELGREFPTLSLTVKERLFNSIQR